MSGQSTPPRKHPLPDSADPLSEPTLNRRIWACYLHLGYSRSSFARALGVDNSVVYNWDTGKSVPTLAHLVNLREVLGRWTADELLYGRDVPRQRTAGGHIDHTMVIDALNALEASADTRQAVALHLESPDGRYQEITREYVLRFAQVYALERANGRSAFESGRVAYAEAVNQSALASAVAGGLVQPKAAPRARRPSRRLPTTRSRAS